MLNTLITKCLQSIFTDIHNPVTGYAHYVCFFSGVYFRKAIVSSSDEIALLWISIRP